MASNLAIIPPIDGNFSIKYQTIINKLNCCENGCQWNKRKVLDINGKYSFGGLMFQKATFLHYGKESGILPWYFTENDVLKNDLIYDKETQTAIADYMISIGDGKSAWLNCYRKLGL